MAAVAVLAVKILPATKPNRKSPSVNPASANHFVKFSRTEMAKILLAFLPSVVAASTASRYSPRIGQAYCHSALPLVIGKRISASLVPSTSGISVEKKPLRLRRIETNVSPTAFHRLARAIADEHRHAHQSGNGAESNPPAARFEIEYSTPGPRAERPEKQRQQERGTQI